MENESPDSSANMPWNKYRIAIISTISGLAGIYLFCGCGGCILGQFQKSEVSVESHGEVQENNGPVSVVVTTAPIPPIKKEPPAAPFKYTVIKKEEFKSQNKLFLKLETTNEVAKKATEEELVQLWEHLDPATFGDYRVCISISTPVPGVAPWAVIIRDPIVNGHRNVVVRILADGIDAEPYCFMNEIDRSKGKQKRMIVALPMLNRLHEILTRRGWRMQERSVTRYTTHWISVDGAVHDLQISPEVVSLQTLGREDDTAFLDTVELVFQELGIADELKEKLFSVIGSPEYMRDIPGEKMAMWRWELDDLLIDYSHRPKVCHNLRVEYKFEKRNPRSKSPVP